MRKARRTRIMAENKIMRIAVEFYANQAHWTIPHEGTHATLLAANWNERTALPGWLPAQHALDEIQAVKERLRSQAAQA